MAHLATHRHTFLFEQLSVLSESLRVLRATPSMASPGPFGHRVFHREQPWKAQDEQIIAKEIASRRMRGDSFGSIARELNRQGLTGRYGSRWYSASVRAYFHRISECAAEPFDPALTSSQLHQ